MTVSNQNNSATLAGNGAATTFPFTLKCFATSDIAITRVNADGTDTALVLDTDYSVVLNANQNTNPGGTITWPVSGSPIATGVTAVVEYAMQMTQLTDIANTGFYPTDTEEMADRNTILIKKLHRILERCIRIPSTMLASTTTLLGKESIANKVIIGKEDGTGFELRTQAEATIADGSITTAKLGGDITAFSKSLLQSSNSILWLALLGFTTFGRSVIAATNAAALRTLLDVSALGSTLMSVASAAAARTAIGATTLGHDLITAANAAAIRTAAGITSAGSTIVTTATANGASFVTAADYAAQKVLWGVTSFGNSVMVAADAAASRVLHGFTTIGSSIVTAADAAAVRGLLSVGTDIPAGGVIQTVFSSTASVDLRIQGVTNKVLVRAVIEYSGLTAGTVYLTVSDEGAPSSTLRTLNLDSVSADVNTATIEWEYAPGIVALHNLTYGVAVTGVTLVAQTISVTEIKGGFTGTALPWSPSDLTATNPKAFKAGLSPATDAVDRGGANTMYGGAVRTWWSRIGSPGTSDFECTDSPPWTMTTDSTSTYIANILVGDIPGAGEYGLLLERAYTGEFTLAYQVRCSSDSFTGDVLFSAGYSSGAVASGSVLRRGFILRDAGMIDFGLDDDVGNKATYDATALDWTAWHSIVVRRTSAGVYHLHVDGSLVGTLTGAVFGGGGSAGSSNAYIAKTADTVSMYIFSAYLADTDVGTGADLTSLNTWLALAE